MDSKRDESRSTLFQLRIPTPLAEKAHLRAKAVGLPTAHWVAALIRQEIEGPRIEAWGVKLSEPPTVAEAARIEMDGGHRSPHYILGIRSYDGQLMTANVFAPTDLGIPLGVMGLQAYGTFQDNRWRDSVLYTRLGSYWRIRAIRPTAPEVPTAVLTLESIGAQFPT